MGAIDRLVWRTSAIEPLGTRDDPAMLLRKVGGPKDRRLFVELSLRDRPGVVQPLSALFAKGFPLSAGCGAHARFNIESCLWGSIADIGAASFVVAPLLTSCATPKDDCDFSLMNGLKDSIQELLITRLKVPKDDILSGPDVREIHEGPDLALFTGRVLGECRFGVCESESSAAEKFAHVLARFAQVLKKEGIPLAYVFGQTRWTDHRPPFAPSATDDPQYSNARWMHIGFALPPDSEIRTRIIGHAFDIASGVGVGFAFLDSHFARTIAGGTDPLMAHQFVHVIPPPGDPVAGKDVTTDQQYDGVLAVGIGRVGLIADLLQRIRADLPGLALVGCSMGVLCGYTVLQLVVPKGQGAKTKAAADTVFKEQDGWATPFDTSGPNADQEHGRVGDRELFWVAWKCDEQVGILAKVVETVSSQLRAAKDRLASEQWQASSEGPNFVYGISRVVVAGKLCAGKLKVGLSEDLATALWGVMPIEQSDFGKALKRDVAKALADEWPGSGASVSVVVSYGEPGAEPWAALPILAGGPFTGSVHESVDVTGDEC